MNESVISFLLGFLSTWSSRYTGSAWVAADPRDVGQHGQLLQEAQAADTYQLLDLFLGARVGCRWERSFF